MDNCCAPQWADFTRSPCLLSDSYFEVEHEVHRSRKQAEELAAEFETKFGDAPVKFEIQVKLEPEDSYREKLRSSSTRRQSSQVSQDRLEMTTPKISLHRTVQNLRLANTTLNKKRRPSNEGPSLRRTTPTVGRRRSSLVKGQAKVLTCQYVKKCPTNARRQSNQYVSLAEAVSKFQSETPERFRTLNHNTTKPMLPAKMKQKLTYPVSPALRCRYRSRTAATPAPGNAINESTVAPRNILKKLAPTVEEPCGIVPKKAASTDPPPDGLTAPGLKQEKVSDCTSNVPEVVPEKKEATNNRKTVAARLPATFEARNKDLQDKREQRVKALQEPAKIKRTLFHAKPVPNFAVKPTATTREQPQKRTVVPCPFSFDQRDKCLAKKREERLKQLQEKVNEPHVFHANPVPSYKPGTVRCASRENLRAKELERPATTRQTKSCYGQENREPNINSTMPRASRRTEIKTEPKEGQSKPGQRKLFIKPEAPSVTLNTDKRARERCEFDEKIRLKKIQEETERQEKERERLEKERQELAELRRLAETRARPMPVFKPPVVLRSLKPLTSPKSPAWAMRKSMKPNPQ